MSLVQHFGGLLAQAILVFVSTDLDDIFVLLTFYADPRFTARQIAIGQFGGIALLYGVGVAGSLLSLVIPPAVIGLLALAPIFIGLKKGWELRSGSDSTSDESSTSVSRAPGRVNGLAVTVVTVANGADNLTAYIPYFASKSSGEVALIGAVFAIMTALWLGFAHWLTHHRALGAPIRRYGNRLTPVMLVAIGLLILYESGSFALLRNYWPI
jgi:cadmium resistance protein CadD (predicted permease)